jgi:hypothetical protein
MLEEVLSAMTRSVPSQLPCQLSCHPGTSPFAPGLAPAAGAPLQDIGRASGPEMAHVDALGTTNPDPALQRLVDVAEQRVPRPCFPDRGQQRIAPPLHPPGHGVIQQLGHGRRDMRAEHVDGADRLDLGGVFLVVDLVRRPVGGAQPAADEPEGPPVELDPLTVQDLLPRPHVLGPQLRQVNIAVGQVGRNRHRGEQLGVLPSHGRLDVLTGVPAKLAPQRG